MTRHHLEKFAEGTSVKNGFILGSSGNKKKIATAIADGIGAMRVPGAAEAKSGGGRKSWDDVGGSGEIKEKSSGGGSVKNKPDLQAIIRTQVRMFLLKGCIHDQNVFLGDIPAATAEYVEVAVGAARKALTRNEGIKWGSETRTHRAKYLRAIAAKLGPTPTSERREVPDRRCKCHHVRHVTVADLSNQNNMSAGQE